MAELVSLSITHTPNKTRYVTGKLCDITCSKGVRGSSYEYDGLGRLTRSCLFGQQKDYVYGDGSTSGMPLGRMSMFGGSQMTYDGNGRLSSIGGTPILYDAYGNMTAKGGTVFRWARGTLLSGAGQVSFEYDFRGTRTVKASAGGLRHVYRYIGGLLVWEDVYTSMGVLVRRLRFFYDNDGLCALRVYEGRQPAKDYAYIRNPFGDIVALWADEGITAVYAYDAWGNCKVYDSNDQENVSASFVGNVNPFRYRSYYYDVETGLYMMGHRYYDPEIGRFISPDDVEYLDPTKINGLNLYAYCNNDPINYVDPSGHSAIALLIAVGVGALLGFIGGTASALIEDYNDNGGIDGSIGWRSYLGSMVGSTIGGAALGFAGGIGALWLGPAIAGTGSLATAFGGVALSTGVSFAGGFLNYSADRWISGEKWKLESALLCGGLTAIEGLVAYGAGGVSSLVNWEGGKIIKLGKYSINVQETIAQNFVSDIFGNPTGWLLDIIMGYYG